MFGIPKNEHDDGYAQAEEWWSIVSRIWAGEQPFDFDGRFFQLKGVEGRPAPYDGQPPIMMNAGMSEVGRSFAIRNSGMHFDGIQSAERIANTKQQAANLGREIQVWTPVGIVCRPTQQEADEFVRYCVDHADIEAIDRVRGGKTLPLEQRVMARGNYCATGTPDTVAQGLGWVQSLGLDGVVLHFVNYLEELPYFVQEVLPRLERMGLRRAVAGAVA
jgi:alkanesulfonate monooxygenase SsuD/methylene tetrahydromethanopterin reductase-like flavin-dependent oxidoreductase (luciferase family)